MKDLPRIVVVGGGFGGLEVVKRLRKKEVEIVLIDRFNFQTFTPLLYQVATSGLETEEITFPLRQMLRGQKNVRIIQATMTGLDQTNKLILTSHGEFGYDYLVLAIGSRTNYFNIPGAEKYSLQLKDLSHALQMRNRVLSLFELASNEDDPEIRKELMSFIVVGGGPTGVEMAGALQELVFGPILKDFPNLEKNEIQIHLVDAKDHVLSSFDSKLQKWATKTLIRKGIELHMKSRITEVEENMVRLDNGDFIVGNTVIWSAGIKGHSIVKNWDLMLNNNDFVLVNPTLQTASNDTIFSIGDMAQVLNNPLPMLATVAIQQGKTVAINIIKSIEKKELRSFKYKDPGTMAVIGRNAAVAQLGRLKLTGILAWFAWSGLHILKLSGIRNRLNVIINWIWSYIFFDRSARIILPLDQLSSGQNQSSDNRIVKPIIS